MSTDATTSRTAAAVIVESGDTIRRRRFAGRLSGWLASTWPPVVTFVLLVAAWQIAVMATGVQEFILPPPTAIIETSFTQAPELLAQTSVTLVEVLIGLVASIVIGIPLAVVIVSFKVLERALYPLLVVTQVIPKIALAPLFLIWFGLGITPKVVMVFLMAFFPIVINTAIGLRAVEIEKLYLARSMGAGPLTTLFRFRIPQALPSIFGGIKVATTLAVVGAIVGEFVGADSGLGYLIQQSNAALNAPMTFAAIVYLSIVGLLLFFIVDVMERLALPWHVSRRDDFNRT